MKILVTGTAGFIGCHVAKRLLERGDTVVGIDVVNDYYDPALKEARLSILNQAAGGVNSGGVFSQRATLDMADPTYEVSEALLHTYFLMLQRAADTGQRVRWHRCSNLKQGCIRALGVEQTPP